MEKFEATLRGHARALLTECMNPAVFYPGLLGLFVIGALLFRNTSIHEASGGTEYERRRRRRFIGIILMLVAVLSAGMALLSQPSSSNAPASYSPPISSAAGQPEIAPVAPPPLPPSQLSSNAPAGYSPPANPRPGQPQTASYALQIRQAFQLLTQKQFDAALAKVNAALQSAPQNPAAYELRGNIYAEEKLWEQAGKDYQTVLQLDGKNTQVKFNLAELQFMQKNYDNARPGFLALKQDPNMGDLASYKVFLCDLFGGHDHAAAAELDAFNQAGSNASYYFANAAWSLVHHKTEDARGWLTSAAKIYEPSKFGLYAFPLSQLGYLPLPPPPQQ